MRTIGQSLVLTGLVILLSGQAALAQRVYVQPGSRLWIEGRSTVNSYSCEAQKVEGYGVLKDRAQQNIEAEEDGGPVRVEVVVPVQSFDCGKSRMNDDLYEAMKADAYPEIAYELVAVTLKARPDTSGGWYQLLAEGQLSIAGVERRIETPVEGRRLSDGRLRATGSVPLKMTDFGVEPPTALFGLIKAHNRIEVHFDLIATGPSTSFANLNKKSGTTP